MQTPLASIAPHTLSAHSACTCVSDGGKEGQEGREEGQEGREVVDQGHVDEVIKVLGWDENPMLAEHPELLKGAKELVTKYIDIFAHPDTTLGKTDMLKFQVKVQPSPPCLERWHVEVGYTAS